MVYSRCEQRRVIAARAQLSWIDAKGMPVETAAMIEDISPGGMGLRSPVQLEVGSLVDVSWKGTVFCGTVMHCRRSGYHHVLGLKRTSKLLSRPCDGSEAPPQEIGGNAGGD